jgi:glycerol-3-phosphate O-acyltransferase/dihydroxyacetone phosphate acyltransferase
LVQKILYVLSWTFVRMFALLMLRLDIHRHSHLPSGPMIFVANHPSATDPFLIHMISRKQQLNVLITAKAFNVPVFGWFLRNVQEIPVPLKEGSSALEQARQHLNRGRSVVIFIEGRISPQKGGFLPPRSGAARLALSSGFPIVPVGIFLRRERCYTLRSRISGGVPAEARWYFHGPYAITVGQPIQYQGDVEDREHVRRTSETIMERIQHLAFESERRMHGQNLVSSIT